MDRFVVGTGRCGSTLLSRMLAEHHSVVSLFEFFNGLDIGRRFDPTPVSGADIARLISAEQPFVTAVLRRGYPVEEIAYPFAPGSRYGRADPLPWVLVAMLPRLSTEPDQLFDALMDFVLARPVAPPAEHYRAIFTWLAQQSKKPLWIERSGSSVDYVDGLRATFPNAYFVHLHRDGPETALSMREHHAYRLPISILYRDPPESGEGGDDLDAIDLAAEPTPTDPITRILASRPEAETFGRYWNDQIVRGMAALSKLPKERTLDVKFEELLAAPERELRRISEFFALPPDAEFLERGKRLIEQAPASRVKALSGPERTRLEEACAPGTRLLGR